MRPQEDLWVELTFYPNKVLMKKIIGKIWKLPQFNTLANALDTLVSKRKIGYQGTLAYARLQEV